MSKAAKTEEVKTEAQTGENVNAINPDDIRSWNIFQRVAAIESELGIVAKNTKVEVSKKNSYKAVSERDILDAVKPLEAKYRVYSYPSDRVILEAEILEGERPGYNGDIQKTTTFFTRIQTTYTFVNIDNPEDRFTTIVFSEGIDTQDKGSGKAMTYADKYALMKAYKISTGDDPDQDPGEPTNYTRQPGGRNQYDNQRPAQQSGQWGNQRPAPESGQYDNQNTGLVRCGQCNEIINAATTRDGRKLTASEVVFQSIQRFNAAYCPDCQNKIIQNRIQQSRKAQK